MHPFESGMQNVRIGKWRVESEKETAVGFPETRFAYGHKRKP